MNRRTSRVLVADHEPSTRKSLCHALHQAGYAVDTAEDGEDVLLLCNVDPPDVLIVDVRLPDMDGFDVCECLRREARATDLTVIVIADANDQMTRTYLGQMTDYVDGDYFFTKPCDAKVLVQLIDDLSDRPHSPDEPRRPKRPTLVTWPTSRPRACFARL
jgi:DNA-binding response OmpR family regulator